MLQVFIYQARKGGNVRFVRMPCVAPKFVYMVFVWFARSLMLGVPSQAFWHKNR